MSFKLVLFAALLCATQVFAYPQPMTECLKRIGADEQYLTTIRQNLDDNNNQKSKDFGLCLSKKLGFIDTEGRLQREAIKKHIELEWKNTGADGKWKAIDKCVVEGPTPLDTAWEITKCFFKTEDDVYV